MMTLFDFSQITAIQAWQSVDDRVMGGVSRSEMVADRQPQPTAALFRGNVSLENNGGFCSVRAPLPRCLSEDVGHLWIRCSNAMKHGKKSYFVNVRTESGFDGLSYRTEYLPSGAIVQYAFAAADFKAVFRGRDVPDAPPLILSDVRQTGLMIAEAQSGPFELTVQSMGAF